MPVRPIMGAFGTPTYLLKYLTKLHTSMRSMTNNVRNSDFIQTISSLLVSLENNVVNFDMVSLFTCIFFKEIMDVLN